MGAVRARGGSSLRWCLFELWQSELGAAGSGGGGGGATRDDDDVGVSFFCLLGSDRMRSIENDTEDVAFPLP